jgi:ferrous iron transport protein B
MGNPNTGKSTLFNRLTGLRQSTGNYPGVTVEKHTGIAKLDDAAVELVDLPGTFSLGAHSMEERIAVDLALGRMSGMDAPKGILAVVAMNNLYQGLFLVHQLCELGLPVLVALTMTDTAQAAGVQVDVEMLEQRLGGATVCPVVATTGQGLPDLRRALAALPAARPPRLPAFWPELREVASRLAAESNGALRTHEVERELIDDSGLTQRIAGLKDDGLSTLLQEARAYLFNGTPPVAAEAQRRYNWVREVLGDVQVNSPAYKTYGAYLVAWLNRPIPGTIGLFVVMAVVFQAVFAWATPLMDAVDGATSTAGMWASSVLPAGAIESLVSDGVIAGVGSVIIFLPQIMILFFFIILLEDSGYLARAAYLMDRVMRSAGLSGQSIIPMISSFACAVPGIMATRVIPNRRDRIATILAAPFMTCSARLPVYALLIAAFVPASPVGWFNLQGIVLFGLYLLGIVAGVLTALLLKQTALRGPKPPFALMLPEFRKPNLRTVAIQLLGRARVFLRRAGTVIFVVAIVVWALAYYPRSGEIEAGLAASESAAAATLGGAELENVRQRLANEAAAAQLEQSWLGRGGKAVAPAFAPLGWDWKITAAVIAGFPAREVVVAVLGTVYAVGDEVDETTLAQRLRSASWPDGSPVFTLPMVLGLLIFYACCLQCAATLAVIRRETNSRRWPIFAWAYMTAIGYAGALLVFRLGSA